MKKFNQKLLSASVSMLMTVSICHVVTAQASDIDIYKLPDATKLSIFMMLDKSGSMSDSWDQPSGVSCTETVSNENDARGYQRTYCLSGTGKKYYFWNKTSGSSQGWYNCGGAIQSPSTNNCTRTSTPTVKPNTDGYRSENSGTRYYKYDSEIEYPDRITRLKDALYELATSNKIPPTTEIGIGTFSDSISINLPSAPWGEVGSTTSQRKKVLDFIATLSANGSTYTSYAYGRAARYMLQGYSPYSSPLDKVTDPKCSGKGIYFLTDGEPNGGDGYATSEMNTAIGENITLSNGLTGGTARYSGGLTQWKQIGAFARDLNNGSVLQKYFSSKQHNNEHQIKTAVVGFGATFDVADTPTNQIRFDKIDPKTGKVRTYYNCSRIPLISGSYIDARNACYWGNKTKFSDGTQVPDLGNPNSYGEGGFYSASSTQDVIQSFVNFVEDMKPEFEPIPTGSPTIPVDALNPIQLQPYGYYASFTPKPQETYQLWLGNLNKYHVKDGRLFDVTKTKEVILLKNALTNEVGGKLNQAAEGIWGSNESGGVRGRLPLGTFVDGAKESSNRTVFTNRQINATNQAEEINSLQQVNLTSLFATGTDGKFRNDDRKNYWLNILGYNVPINAVGLTAATLPTSIRRQLGAVMHSKPLLLTQAGKIKVTDGIVGTDERQDYLLFGTTQGSLHVVKVENAADAKQQGEEVFTFVPHEMIQDKPEAFLSEDAVSGGRDNLFYGMDGAWTAYTQYVSKTDKTLTVGGSGRTAKDASGAEKDLNQKGIQWVYGGLRLGGQSYYALDLTDISSPSLKFHIDPKNQKLISSSGTKSSVTPLSYMGDSWSKPTIAWVKWGGTRRLVMFVGGGYDSTGTVQCGDATRNNPDLTTYDAQNRFNNKGYECPKYSQTNQKGAGVYMFDAGSGELLWWASANVGTSTSPTTDNGTIATNDANLKYSVVSQINAVDRDGDGMVDHLFFGDLGGQAFRIDLNNKAATLGTFAKRIARLYDAHQTNGSSPRFYEMPSFSVHSGVDGYFGALSLSSGNRSSPLAGTHMINGANVTTQTANDAVYVIYDNDVARSNLYSIDDSDLRTKDVSLALIDTFAKLKAGTVQAQTVNNVTTYNGGWKYQYSITAGKYKGMNEIYALDNMLYVNIYHKDGDGIRGDCGSGVIGDTELYQFCLPTGKCPNNFYDSGATGPNKIVLGGGILGTGLGLGYSNKSNEMSIVKGKEGADCTIPMNKNKPECQLFDTGARLQHLRWYESR